MNYIISDFIDRYNYSKLSTDSHTIEQKFIDVGWLAVSQTDLDALNAKQLRWSDDFTYLEPTPTDVLKQLQEQKIKDNLLAELQNIRTRREIECFSVINRGQLWYNKLTDDQKNELSEWYQQWLDAPETGVIPKKPSWLN